MPERIHDDLLAAAGHAHQRLIDRLAGLTDEEYWWEPAPGCWTVRQGTDGGWEPDGAAWPVVPAPLTTIAWRTWHLTDVLAAERNATWLGAEPVGTLDPVVGAPTADWAVARLDAAYDLFARSVAAADPAALTEPMGEVAGEYAEDSGAAFVLHQLDELVHHGAEIAAMRDLHRALQQADPFHAACLRLDRGAVAELLERDPGLRTRHAGLVAQLAADRRWDGMRLLVDHGFDVNASAGVSALHYAAAAGELGVVERLLDRGADRRARDTQFDLPPVEWARFFGQDDAAVRLGSDDRA